MDHIGNILVVVVFGYLWIKFLRWIIRVNIQSDIGTIFFSIVIGVVASAGLGLTAFLFSLWLSTVMGWISFALAIPCLLLVGYVEERRERASKTEFITFLVWILVVGVYIFLLTLF